MISVEPLKQLHAIEFLSPTPTKKAHKVCVTSFKNINLHALGKMSSKNMNCFSFEFFWSVW